MVDLVVSTWHRPSREQQELTSLSVRMNLLRRAVAATGAQIAERQFDAGGLIRGIFVAPEYFFAALNAGLQVKTVTRQRTISQGRHNLVVEWLKALSRDHRRILIVPGTIAWETPFASSDALDHIAWYQGKADHQQISQADLLKQIKAAWFWNLTTKTLISWSEWMDQKELGSSPPTQTLRDKTIEQIKINDPKLFVIMRRYARLVHEMGIGAVRRLARLPGLAPRRAMYNTAYGFLNGEIVLTYNKQGNFNEEVGADDLFFISGGKSGLREIEGIRFGFEVCLDHNIGMLKRQLRAGGSIDVQIVLSDAVDPSPDNIIVRQDGFYVHASTDQDFTACIQKTDKGPVPAPSLGVDTVGDSQLRHWRMSLNVNDPFDLSDTKMGRLLASR